MSTDPTTFDFLMELTGRTSNIPGLEILHTVVLSALDAMLETKPFSQEDVFWALVDHVIKAAKCGVPMLVSMSDPRVLALAPTIDDRFIREFTARVLAGAGAETSAATVSILQMLQTALANKAETRPQADQLTVTLLELAIKENNYELFADVASHDVIRPKRFELMERAHARDLVQMSNAGDKIRGHSVWTSMNERATRAAATAATAATASQQNRDMRRRPEQPDYDALRRHVESAAWKADSEARRAEQESLILSIQMENEREERRAAFCRAAASNVRRFDAAAYPRRPRDEDVHLRDSAHLA